ncbi:hypothetical protein BJP25_23115 [Actinokineospora bangkokensis]|uniref:Carrier domain-containing protein n=1 Tax=Actinokineospora bangkokensis TaxID=1193682 RepID=A0A1Q9LJW1_9PSEU|nr:hypothetical protein BJP25_23115 [Actinokineospora bangkokensis]
MLPVERWFLAYPRGREAVVQLVVEGTGVLDPEQVRAAVRVAAQACPGTRLRRRGGRWEATGPVPAVVAVDGDALDRTTFEGLPELRGLPAGPKGTTCEVLLLTGARPGLVFRADHAVMDAGGCALWAAAVFRALRGEAVEPADSTATYLDLVRAAGPVERPGELAREWPPPVPMPQRRTGVLWRRRTVDGTFPAVTAKVAQAVADATGLPRSRFGVSVDMRRHDRSIRSTANFSKIVTVDAEAGGDWQAVYTDLLDVLRRKQEMVVLPDTFGQRLPIPVMRGAMDGLEKLAAKRGHLATGTLTHLGRFELAECSTPTFEALSVLTLTTPAPGSALELDIVESGGHTELTLGWWAGGSDELADELLDAVVEALSPRELREWAGNDTDRELRDARTVVEQFRDQVARTPHAPAVSSRTEDLSYAELDRRSDAVTEALLARGVGPGSVVGVLADRSVLAVVAVWGVMKAGAAYLPLDAKHPAERVKWLLGSAGAPVCLAQRPHDLGLEVPEGCGVVILDELPHAPQEPVPAVVPAAADLAYVIYTSGSTGQPKGVEVPHDALANYAEWCADEYGVDATSRLPLLVSLSFDVSGISLVVPLVRGGALLVMREELNHLALQEVLDAGANVIALTPSHLDLISRLDLSSDAVRVLIVIGEQFRRSVALRARELFGPGCRVANHYGPAEATIGVTSHDFDPDADTGPVVPIGNPGYNTTAFLLDPDGRFVEPGEPGELYLGGVQLARGYRGRPDLTRARFTRLADGRRVYRTGDIARLLPSGELEVTGRIDDQVKILGHRVEPTEVSQTLERHPGVGRATVVVRSRGAAKVLAAYAVPAAGGPVPEPTELTAYLCARLPEYMVPATMQLVDDIPLSVNGKVDAKRLPVPPGAEQQAGPAGVTDEVELAVRAIWADVLGVEADRIDRETDFHHLGGTSLTLLAMVGAVAGALVAPEAEEAFTARIAEITRDPSVRRVADLVRSASPVSTHA